MSLVDLVAMMAIAQFLTFSVLVGRARVKYGVRAPAIMGSENFERAYRVQMNTLELLVAFIPALYVASKYWSSLFVAVCGVIYLIGRLVYRRSYLAAPDTRSFGFLLSFAPVVILILSAVVGAVRSLISGG